jgi:hypothetical protein
MRTIDLWSVFFMSVCRLTLLPSRRLSCLQTKAKATRLPSVQELLEDGPETTDTGRRRSTETMEDSPSRKREATVSPESSNETVPSDDTTGGKAAKKSRKTVTFDGPTEAAPQSESDSRMRAAALREERSRRRDEKGAFVRKGAKGAHPKKGEDTEVVRVPMLTGTLLLYRGAKPRAVFVRRV